MSEAMNLTFQIHLEKTKEKDNSILIRKFYQVVFISPKQKKIDIYTCIVCGGKKDLSLRVTTLATAEDAKTSPANLRRDVLADFRREPGPWQLYWGKSAVISGVTQADVIDQVHDYKRQCIKKGKTPHIAATTFEDCFVGATDAQKEAESISYLILPGNGAFEADPTRNFSLCIPAQVKSGQAQHDSVLRRTSQSYSISRKHEQADLPEFVDIIDWSQLEFENVVFRNESGELPCSVRWDFVSRLDEERGVDGTTSANGIVYRIDDFKVYFVVRNGQEIDTDSALILGTLGSVDDKDPNPFDRMTRQPSAYFRKWITELDINASAVYRLQGRQIRSISEVPYKKIELHFRIKPARFTYGQLVAAFALPFVAAIGLDSTRLDSAKNVLSDVCSNGSCWFDGAFAKFPYQLGWPDKLDIFLFPSVAFMIATIVVSILILVNAFGGGQVAFREKEEPDYTRRKRTKLLIGAMSSIAYLFFAAWMACIVLAADNNAGNFDPQIGYFSSSSIVLTVFLSLTRFFWVVSVASASGALLLISRKGDLFELWGMRQTMPIAIKIGQFSVVLLLVFALLPEIMTFLNWILGFVFLGSAT